MSSTSKKQQRNKRSFERIIPIEIESNDEKIHDNVVQLNDTIEVDDDSTPPISITSTKDPLNDSSSSDVSDIIKDDSICSIEKPELSDDTERRHQKGEEIDIKIPERMLPPYNVPEKIILILDRAVDEVSTYFELSNGNKLKPLDMLKDAIKFFLYGKSSFDGKHEFALMLLNGNSASWMHDFTSNVESIIDDIDDIEECDAEDIFDMATVFDLINKMIKVPTPKNDLVIPPPFVVRAIFLYSRSITMPEIKMTEEISNLLESPYFTFDVTMTHEIPDSSNKCNLIFKELQQFDTKGFAYFFPVSRNPSHLYTALAKLLSHPLQRCTQKDADYKFNCTEK